jgi:hypothetical protein
LRGAYLSFHSDRTVCVHIPSNAVSHITRRANIFARLVSCTFLMLGVACDPVVNRVRVEPGTAPLKPVFVLTDTTGHAASGNIYGLSVVLCGTDSALWQIAATGASGPPSRLEYGVTPAGYATHVGPQPLRPGCYEVLITDGRRARFRVSAAGQVIVEARPDSQRSVRRDTLRR